MLLQLLVKKEWLYEDLTCQLVLEELSILNENDDDKDFPPPGQRQDNNTIIIIIIM